MPIPAWIGILGAIAAFEGIAAVLEHVMGDPEADVTTALQQLAAKNQRRAFGEMATEQAGTEYLDERFSKLNQIPSRLLTQAAMSRTGPPVVGGGTNTEVLDMISQRLGISPEDLIRASSPSRMGDTSSLIRQMGDVPVSAPVPPPTQAPAPQVLPPGA